MDRYETPVSSLWECEDGETYVVVISTPEQVVLARAYDGSGEVVETLEDWQNYVHGGYYTYVGMNW
jgi:hypothetical protein